MSHNITYNYLHSRFRDYNPKAFSYLSRVLDKLNLSVEAQHEFVNHVDIPFLDAFFRRYTRNTDEGVNYIRIFAEQLGLLDPCPVKKPSFWKRLINFIDCAPLKDAAKWK